MATNMTSSQRRLVGVLCLAVTLAAGCDSNVQGFLDFGSAKPACTAPDNSDRLVQEVLSLVNQQRVLRGMNPLTLNEKLAAAGISYACAMIEDGFFGHENPATGDGFAERHSATEFRCHPAGENLALGHTSAAVVVEDWMNSSSHRDNILTDGYLEMGLGLRQDSVDGRLYWVQLFVGERVEGCANDLEFNDEPVSTSYDVGGLTGGLSSAPALPSAHDDEPLTDNTQVKPESADPSAAE